MKPIFKKILLSFSVLSFAFSMFAFTEYNKIPNLGEVGQQELKLRKNIDSQSASIGKVGERIDANGGFITVLNTQVIKELGSFMKADAGKIFLDVEVYFENENSEKNVTYNPMYFKVKDSEGQEFTSYMTAIEPNLGSGELKKGDFVRGHIAFEVLETSNGFVMAYEPMVLFGDNQVIKVDLSQTAENPITNPDPKPIPAIFKIGEKAELNGIGLTILGLSQQATLSGFLTPAQGNTFVDIEVVIENFSRDEETPYNPFYFKLKDSRGYEYQSAMGSVDPSLTSGNLNKGEKVKGHVAFEVKTDVTGLVAIYEPMIILNNYDPIIINLVQ